LGAEVIFVPVIGIGPPSNPEPLRRAAEHCDGYDWIVFSSVNAVTAFAEQLFRAGKCAKARVASVGAATRAAAEQHGFRVAVMPEKYVAESLVGAMEGEALNGARVLIPGAAVTRDVIASELRKRGAQVDVVEAYRNTIPADAAQRARDVFHEPYPDWVTFASSSAVDHLVVFVGTEPLSRVKIASIGPVTSETVRSYGLAITAEAATSSVQGLIQAVCDQTRAR
jgi:uroporphyrinogen-III synthase